MNEKIKFIILILLLTIAIGWIIFIQGNIDANFIDQL